MTEFLASGQPIAVGDSFSNALTLGPAAGVSQITFSVLSPNAVIVQCYKYTNRAHTEWVLEPFTRVFAGQSIGVILKNCAGIRIANATPGLASVVIGQLDYPTDIELAGGLITSANISATGNIVLSQSGLIVAFGFHFAPVNTGGNNFAGGADMLSPSPLAFTADGVSNYLVTVAAASWQLNALNHAAEAHINFDGTDAGQLAQMVSVIANVGETFIGEGVLLTPAQGPHTVNVRAWADSAGDTLTIIGGPGGAGQRGPIIVKVIQLTP